MHCRSQGLKELFFRRHLWAKIDEGRNLDILVSPVHSLHMLELRDRIGSADLSVSKQSSEI